MPRNTNCLFSDLNINRRNGKNRMNIRKVLSKNYLWDTSTDGGLKKEHQASTTHAKEEHQYLHLLLVIIICHICLL
jgi:hypothetical protein